MTKPAFDLARFLPYRLSVTTNRISRAFARRYAADFGLSIPEWRVIAVLGSYAPLSSNQICRRAEMDKAKVSRAVTRLVSAGLLARKPNRDDQRLIELSLTRKGRAAYDAIVPLARQMERELTEALGPGERKTLDRLLAKLYQRAAVADGED